MHKSIKPLVLACAVGAVALVSISAGAQQAPRPEQLIKWRQSAFQVIAWNTGRIKAAIDGTGDKAQVKKAAATIAAIANSGLGSLFAAGTETGKGWHDTAAKPALFTNTEKVANLNADFAREATELARVAASGDDAALKEQFATLQKTCKSCHDDYRTANN